MIVGSNMFYPLKIILLRIFIAKKALFQKKMPAPDFGSKLFKVYIYKYDQKLCDQPNYLLEGSLVAKFLNGIVYILVKETIDGTSETFFLWYFPFKGTVLYSTQVEIGTVVHSIHQCVLYTLLE